MWKHAVAEELAALQIRVRGGEESLADGAREHRRDPGGQEGDVGDRCFPRQVRPTDASVQDLILGDLTKDLLDPGLHLLREQRGQGRYALRLGDAARGDHFVEDGRARPEASRRDGGVFRGSGHRLAVHRGEIRAKGRMPVLVLGRPPQERGDRRIGIERFDGHCQPGESAGRLALDARSKGPRLSGLPARLLAHQPETPPPASGAMPPSESPLRAVPASEAVPSPPP